MEYIFTPNSFELLIVRGQRTYDPENPFFQEEDKLNNDYELRASFKFNLDQNSKLIHFEYNSTLKAIDATPSSRFTPLQYLYKFVSFIVSVILNIASYIYNNLIKRDTGASAPKEEDVDKNNLSEPIGISSDKLNSILDSINQHEPSDLKIATYKRNKKLSSLSDAVFESLKAREQCIKEMIDFAKDINDKNKKEQIVFSIEHELKSLEKDWKDFKHRFGECRNKVKQNFITHIKSYIDKRNNSILNDVPIEARSSIWEQEKDKLSTLKKVINNFK